MTRQDDAGFTLIEALVAMAVLALGAVSLLSATQGQAVSVDSALSGTERVLYILDGYVAAGDPL